MSIPPPPSSRRPAGGRDIKGTKQLNEKGEPVKEAKEVSLLDNATEFSDFITPLLLTESLAISKESSTLGLRLKDPRERRTLIQRINKVINFLKLNKGNINDIINSTHNGKEIEYIKNIELNHFFDKQYYNLMDGYENYWEHGKVRGTFINYTSVNKKSAMKWSDKNILELIRRGAIVEVTQGTVNDPELTRDFFFKQVGNVYRDLTQEDINQIEDARKKQKAQNHFDFMQGVLKGERSFFDMNIDLEDSVISWIIDLLNFIDDWSKRDKTDIVKVVNGNQREKSDQEMLTDALIEEFTPMVHQGKYATEDSLRLSRNEFIGQYGTGVDSSRVSGSFAEGYIPIRTINNTMNLTVGADNYTFITSNIVKVDMSGLGADVEIEQEEKNKFGDPIVFKYVRNAVGKPIYIMRGIYLDKMGNVSIGQIATTINFDNDGQVNNVTMSLLERMLVVRLFPVFESMPKDEFMHYRANKKEIARAFQMNATNFIYPRLPVKRESEISCEEIPKKRMLDATGEKLMIEDVKDTAAKILNKVSPQEKESVRPADVHYHDANGEYVGVNKEEQREIEKQIQREKKTN